MAYLTRGRSIAAIEEATYAAGGVITDGDYFDFTAGDMSVDIEQIEREVLRNSLVKLAGIAGQETSSGSVTVELSEDNLVSGINGDNLFRNGIGVYFAGTAAGETITAAADANNFTVSDVTGLRQGAMLKVKRAANAVDEFVAIVSITGLDIVCTPALGATPVVADTIEQVVSYVLPRPNDPVLSLMVREHLTPTVIAQDAIDYDYLGVMVDSVNLNFPVGAIATADFSLSGAGSSTDTPAADPTLSCETLTPVVGKNATVTVLDVPYNAQDLNVQISTTNTDILSITTDGITNKVGTEKTVGGTFRTEYVGTNNFDALVESTRGIMHIQMRDGNSTSPVIVGVFMPQVKFTNVVRTDDAGILYDEVTYEAESPDCEGNERALTLYFAN